VAEDVLIELYRYRIRAGMQEEWQRFMVTEAIPRQTAAGMVILGHFWDRDDPEAYWWMRRFNDQTHRDALYALVYEDQYWVDVIRPEIWRLAVPGSGETFPLIPTETSPIH
jgi:hypothetical protein